MKIKKTAIRILAFMAVMAATDLSAATITGNRDVAGPVNVDSEPLYIGDGSTETNYVISSGDSYAMTIEGSNAAVYINNANFSITAADKALSIGNLAPGYMEVDNGSVVNVAPITTIVLGDNQGHKGVLTVKGGSQFTGAYNNLWIYDGTINVEGSGTVMTACAAIGGGLNYRVLLGVPQNSESNINVRDGAAFITAASQLVSNWDNNTVTNITVDGAGSTFTHTAQTVNEGGYPVGTSGNWVYKVKGEDIPDNRASGWYDEDSTGGAGISAGNKGNNITYLCDSGTDAHGKKNGLSKNCVTNITATNGGAVNFETVLTYIGSFKDEEKGISKLKMANFYIGEQSSVSMNRLQIYSSTNIENSGSFKATDVTLFSGADLTYTGHYGTASGASAKAGAVPGFNVNNMTCRKGSSWTINGNDAIINAQSLTFEQGSALTINVAVSAANQSTPIIGGQIDKLTMKGSVTLNFGAVNNLPAGSYKIFNAADEEWAPENITLTGVDAELQWEGNYLVLSLDNQVIVQIDPLADAVQAANWGVFESSQAFTGILWAPHTNAVSLTPEEEKAPRSAGQSVAWASAYSQFSEIGGSRGFHSYDYSIYGGAVGVERRFSSGRLIGAALGYDWGKASPAGMNNVDQKSLHGALYGCAGKWDVSRKDSIRADWSLAAGTTESGHKLSAADWSQDSLQLDVRATYTHQLNERTAISCFAGMQYYAQSDDRTARIKADSLQNLRMTMGVGVSRAIGRTTVFGELAIHNDTMRHNPGVEVDGIRCGSGSNPGRLGGSISVGAEYSLDNDWTLRGNYSFEGADDHKQHSINAGAVYSF